MPKLKAKDSRKVKKVSVDLFEDQVEDIKELFPSIHYAKAMRLVLDKMIKMLKENQARVLDKNQIQGEVL